MTGIEIIALAFGGFLLGTLACAVFAEGAKEIYEAEAADRLKAERQSEYIRGFMDGREANDDHIRALHEYCDYWHLRAEEKNAETNDTGRACEQKELAADNQGGR